MGAHVEPFCSRRWLPLAATALIGIGAAGCSTDTTRFSENPFASPYASNNAARGEVTGSVASAPSTRSSGIEQRPLAAPQGAAGATPGVPQQSLQYAGAPAQRIASNAPPAQSSQASTVHVVQPGETLMSLGRRYGASRAEIARANNLPQDYRVQIGQKIVIPGLRAAHAPAQTPAKPPSTPQPPVFTPASITPAAPKPTGGSQKVANAESSAAIRVAHPAAEPNGEDAREVTGATPIFRWPVRGRVIAGFGPKPNGQQNDGINLAVPEGASIKASEDGVVAYAGSELKGYGNLVLVRHNNGYVTAYAHASELLVKRGDQVKRGQIIARAGQTGNVSSPQLHFEIRKGKEPVDPVQFLAGG